MPEHKLQDWEAWTSEHCTCLWKAYFADSEGSLELKGIHVVAANLDEAKELAQIWVEATLQTDDEPIIITKVEMLEWVCIR